MTEQLHLDSQRVTQLINVSQVQTRHEVREEAKVVSSGWEKAAGKGDVPTRRPLTLLAGVNAGTTLVETKSFHWRWLQVMWIPLSWGPSCLPCIIRCKFLISLAKGRPGWSVQSAWKNLTIVNFTWVNLADKEPQAKLMEAIRTNYNYRYDEIRHPSGSNILGPKLVACIAKLEEAKAEELAIKLRSVHYWVFCTKKVKKKILHNKKEEWIKIIWKAKQTGNVWNGWTPESEEPGRKYIYWARIMSSSQCIM